MLSSPEYLAEAITRWQTDPVAFVVEAFAAKPWLAQRRILTDLAERGRVAVKAGHGVGKTTVESWAIWWQLVCWDHSVVAATAPTSHQLYDVLWAELARWRTQMVPWLAGQFRTTKDRIVARSAEETWFAVARTARPEAPEGLQGFHVQKPGRLLVVMEEASGIPEPIFQVLEGALTSEGCRAIQCGNPTRASGYFFETFKANRQVWACHTLSCLEAPKRLVSPAYAEGIARRFGRDSNVYRVRVAGLFPKSDDDAVVPLEWAEAALNRELPESFSLRSKYQIVLGVDVARFGSDDTAVVARQGRAILGAWVWHGHDLSSTIARVVAIAQRVHRHTSEYDENGRQVREGYFPKIAVDTAGVGAGVADGLAALTDEDGNRFLPVVQVNAGERPSDKAEFERLRDELWWAARVFFQDDDPILAEPGERCGWADWNPMAPAIDREVRERLTAELATPKYVLSRAGRVRVESKDEVKKRLGEDGGHSPDVADALMVGLYVGNVLKPEPRTQESWQETVSQPKGGWKRW